MSGIAVIMVLGVIFAACVVVLGVRRARRAGGVLLTFVVVFGLILPAQVAVAAPAMAQGTGGPTIWTGYVREWRGASPYSGYYSAHAEWTVPDVQCPPRPGAEDYRMSMWVGLGGWNGAYPFAQTGVSINCPVNGGAPSYVAWREYISGVFGRPLGPGEYQMDWSSQEFPVVPGDTMIADVVYENGQSLVRLTNSRWRGPAEERLAVPRVVIVRVGPIVRYLPINTVGMTAEVILEPFKPAPIFDHVVFRNATVSNSIYLPGFGYVPPRWLPLSFFRPDPYGSWNSTSGQVFYPTDFIDSSFAVFQTFNSYNPFPPSSYPGDINGVEPARS